MERRPLRQAPAAQVRPEPVYHEDVRPLGGYREQLGGTRMAASMEMEMGMGMGMGRMAKEDGHAMHDTFPEASSSLTATEEDYLDIPAFLRRQQN